MYVEPGTHSKAYNNKVKVFRKDSSCPASRNFIVKIGTANLTVIQFK